MPPGKHKERREAYDAAVGEAVCEKLSGYGPDRGADGLRRAFRLVGICCNVLLFAAKVTVGWMINSISVMADGFNNLSDAASSVISLSA